MNPENAPKNPDLLERGLKDVALLYRPDSDFKIGVGGLMQIAQSNLLGDLPPLINLFGGLARRIAEDQGLGINIAGELVNIFDQTNSGESIETHKRVLQIADLLQLSSVSEKVAEEIKARKAQFEIDSTPQSRADANSHPVQRSLGTTALARLNEEPLNIITGLAEVKKTGKGLGTKRKLLGAVASLFLVASVGTLAYTGGDTAKLSDLSRSIIGREATARLEMVYFSGRATLDNIRYKVSGSEQNPFLAQDNQKPILATLTPAPKPTVDLDEVLPPENSRILHPEEPTVDLVQKWAGKLRGNHDEVITESVFTTELAYLPEKQREQVLDAIAEAHADALIENYGNTDTIIGLDPGHGGNDIGSSAKAVNGKLLVEKDLTWNLSNRIAEKIYKKTSGKYIVVFLRPQNPSDIDYTGDGGGTTVDRILPRKVTLLQAEQQLRKDSKDFGKNIVYLSVHFNASNNNAGLKGTQVFWPNEVGEPNKLYRESSAKLAKTLDEKIVEAIRATDYQVRDMGATEDPDKNQPLSNFDTTTGPYVALGSPKLNRVVPLPIPLSKNELSLNLSISDSKTTPLTFPETRPIQPTLLEGEGKWTTDGLPKSSSEDILMARTFIRPDVDRPYANVGVLIINKALTKLHLVGGTEHPGGDRGVRGSGKIAKDDIPNLLVTLNGGFQGSDGDFGMFADGKEYRPLRDGLATVAITKDGTILMGEWGETLKWRDDMVSVRQNAAMLVENGKVTNLAKNQGQNNNIWGYVNTNSAVFETWRSAMGLTKNGDILIADGNNLSAETLADALEAAGAEKAMQLDMNTPYVQTSIFNKKADGTLKADKFMTSMYDNNAGRYLDGAWPRDFFYMTKNK